MSSAPHPTHCHFMGWRSLALAAGVAILLSACSSVGTIAPGGRTDTTQAQSDIAACRSTARSTAEQAGCSAKFGPALAKAAQDNFDQAGQAQERATRIGLYATAANAGWDSGIDSGLQVADAAIQAGGAECDKIPSNEFTPARDCALLQVGPAFVAHVRTVILLARVEAALPSVNAAEKKQFADASTRYVRNTFDFVEARRKRIDSDPNADASLRTLLNRQRAVFYCTALQISAVNRRLGQADVARRVSRDRDRILAADRSLRSETCAAAA